MDTENIYRLFGYLISLLGTLFFAIPKMQREYKWSNQAKIQVGSPDWIYALIILFPIRLFAALIFLCFVVIIIGIIAIVLLIYNISPHPFLISILDNALWIVVATSILAILVYFNLLSRGLLLVTKFLDHLRFKAGWVNSNWQIHHYKEFFALNTDISHCERLANSIYRQIKSQGSELLFEQLIEPKNLTQDELANFLLFKCVIESCIHQLYTRDREILSKSQAYLAWAAETPAGPFQPSKIIAHTAADESFYKTLLELPNDKSLAGLQPQGSLPGDPTFYNTVQSVLKQLARKFKGKGSRLAIDLLHRRGSPIVLLSRLRKFDRFSQPGDEAMRRLFLKLSTRMRIWPNLDPGPFLYPYNNGIATLLLNSGCIVSPVDLKFIEIDEDFKNLVAGSESIIIEICYKMVHDSKDQGIVSFCQQKLNCDPSQIELWGFQDFIDLWLYSHTRQFCSVRTNDKTGKSLGCVLAAGNEAACFCDSDEVYWHLDGRTLKRVEKG